MSKILGFLTGVCLTGAACLMMLDRWQPEKTGEASRAAMATDIEPLNVMPKAADKVAATVDEEPDVPSIETVTDDSQNAVTAAADAEIIATVDPGSVLPSSLSAAVAKVEQQHTRMDLTAAKSTTTAGKQVSGVPGEGVSSPAQSRDPQMAGDNHDSAQTHIFWSPFRSEWAARGFARRLTNATQIPIEIVEAGSSQYRVSFDYQDEVQRQEHVERIESITGLQLE